MTALLAIEDLRAFYGDSIALHGISLSVRQGGITALLGANGAGKTTTLRAISGLVRRQGRILLDGRPIEALETEEVARLGVAHVPEGRGTFTDLTVEENLRLGGIIRRDKAAVRQDLDRLLGHFPRLKERWRQQAGTLMLWPRLLLLDEPSFGLAPLVVQEIFRIMARINREEGVGLLIVEQNARLALQLAQDAYLLETGRVVLGGTADQVGADDGVRRAYLGHP